MRPIYLFDDGRGLLSPLTDLRPVFDVRTGAMTLVGRLAAAGELQVIGAFVPDHLADLTRERHTMSVNPVLERSREFIAVNARCPMVRGAEVQRLTKVGSAVVHETSGEIVAAILTPALFPALVAGDTSAFRIEKAADSELLRPYTRPWHVRNRRDTLLRYDMSLLMNAMGGGTAGPMVHVAANAKVHPSAVMDTDTGPVYLADHATVRPGAILCGPCYVGPHATVLDRAVIRPNTAIGPYCKVAGEVSGVIFQGHTNKSHEGFLGDSWVGEWVNLGAGTTNSNLLNTYGDVISRVSPDAPNEYTGEQFMGAIIGDHVKTAICTRIMTGAVVHTGSMLAQTAAVNGCIPAFSWVTDEGAKTYRLSKFVEVVKAVMARRGMKPSAAYLKRMEGMASSVEATKG